MARWFKENVLGSLVAALLGAFLTALFISSGNILNKQVHTIGQSWVPDYSLSFSLSESCPANWRKIGYSVVEIDQSVESTLKNLPNPNSGSNSLYEHLNVIDGDYTVENWNLVKLNTCLKEPSAS